MRKIIISIFLIVLLMFAPSFAKANEGVRIALMGLKLNASKNVAHLREAYGDILSSRMGVDGVIVINPEDIVAAIGSSNLPYVTDSIKKSLEGLSDYILLGSLSVIGNNLSLDMKLIDVKGWTVHPLSEKGKEIDDFMSMIDKLAGSVMTIIKGTAVGSSTAAVIQKKASLKQERPPSKNNNSFVIVQKKRNDESIWKSQSFPLAFKALEVTDLDGDGNKEVVLLNESNLYIYSFKNEGLELRKELKGDNMHVNYGITSGNLNSNNTLPEIYLTRTHRNIPSSGVIEYVGGDFNFIASDIPWFIRVLKVTGKKSMLLGEKFRYVDGFYGGVKVLSWDGDTIKEVDRLDIPKRKNLYGFTLLDINQDGRDDFLYLDDNDRLRINSKKADGSWDEIWISHDYFGGTLNNISYGERDPADLDGKAAKIKGRILVGDKDDTGKMDIIVNGNKPGGLGRLFKKVVTYESGKIFGLTWNGVGLDERWRTKTIFGYIADYIVTDLDSDGNNDLVVLVVKRLPTALEDGESYLLAVKIGQIQQ